MIRYLRGAVVLLAAFLTACAGVVPGGSGPASSTPGAGTHEEAIRPTPSARLRGQVQFSGSNRAVSATMNDVAVAATVSLIDTATNRTIATTKTDDNGVFELDTPGFQPAAGKTYYVEAVKGLSSNRPGVSAARVRTVAGFVGGGWLTLTTPRVVLSPATTALSVAGALRGVADFGPYLGKIDVSGPAVYSAVGAVSSADYSAVLGIISSALAQDLDPVGAVGLQAGSWVPLLGQKLTATAIAPGSGTIGTSVTITGTGFATTASNVVTFGGAAAPAVASADGTTLTTTVPAEATSGQITVTVGNTSVLGPLFVIKPRITSVTPLAGVAGESAGRTGSVVTIYGDGFGSMPTVTFNGVAGTIVSKSPTAITAALPYGVTTGPVQVTAGGNTASGPTVTIVPNAQANRDLESFTIGSDPTMWSNEGGGSTQNIVSTPTARSGSKVLRWSYCAGIHRRRWPGIVPTKKVVVAGAWVRGNTNVNSWKPRADGDIFGQSIVKVYIGIWGTKWLTTYPTGGTYPYTIVPDTAWGQTYPKGDTWTYIQATASAEPGFGYEYGVAIQGNPWADNPLLWDVDDLILFESD